MEIAITLPVWLAWGIAGLFAIGAALEAVKLWLAIAERRARQASRPD